MLEQAGRGPALSILAQPARFYRCLPESRVRNGRFKRLVGRNQEDSTNMYMKVRIGDFDPGSHRQLQLTVCTVNAEDKAPHPFQLYGDNCENGYFALEKSVAKLAGKEFWDICFDNLAIISVPKTADGIEDGMNTRRRNVPKLFDCPIEPLAQYQSDNLGRIRLAFSLSIMNPNGEVSFQRTRFSEEIINEDDRKDIEIQKLNPAKLPMNGRCTVAIYTMRTTAGIDKTQVKVTLTATGANAGNSPLECRVLTMKKRLLVVETPDMAGETSSSVLRCLIAVSSHGFAGTQHELQFVRN